MENIIDIWVKNPQRDYEEGVSLFGKYGDSRTMLRYFQNTKARFGMDKLVHEMEKLVRRGKGVVASAAPLPVHSKPAEPEAPKADLPPAAEAAKQQTHDAWVEMSKLQNELYATGTDNDEASMAKRKEIMEKRDPIVERYNELYEGKEAFFAGKMTEEELQEVVDGKAKEPEKAPKKEVSPCGEMTDVQLTKRSHAVQTNITRVQNQLDYQQDKKGKAKNPMPDCPKRKKLEQKLATLREEQAAIEAEIKKRGL